MQKDEILALAENIRQIAKAQEAIFTKLADRTRKAIGDSELDKDEL